jgi:hypothetical protein
MKKEEKSKLARTCCCVDGICYRFSRKLDLLECYSRGGTFSASCSECK